jgi:hypothetical protein
LLGPFLFVRRSPPAAGSLYSTTRFAPGFIPLPAWVQLADVRCAHNSRLLNIHCTTVTKLAPQQNRQGYTSGPFDPLFSGGPALTILMLAAFGCLRIAMEHCVQIVSFYLLNVVWLIA